MTASQLLNTWFVKTFGQRYAFCIVLVIFLTGGFICGLSSVLDIIIFGRVMQGLPNCSSSVATFIHVTASDLP